MSNFKFYIPNIVTATRIVLTPFAVSEVVDKNFTLACVYIFIACISDWLDGFLARFACVSSTFGKMFDPLADKIFIASLVLALAYIEYIPIWFVAIILLRDLIIILCTSYAYLVKINVNITPIFISKINTVLQLFFIVISVFQMSKTFGATVALVYYVLIYVTSVTTLISGYFYAQRFVQTCKQR